jgi:hypothetical protein
MTKSRFIVSSLAGVLLVMVLVMPVYADTCRIQMPASGYDPLGGDNVTLPGMNPWTRLGQRVSMTDRTVLSIGYHVRRVGSPTGNVTLAIRDALTDEILFSAVWGDASQLPESGQSGYCEVELGSPMLINQDVRICVEYNGGNSTDYCQGAYYTGDKITGESYTNYNSQWHDIGEAEEGSYCYSYVCQAEPPDGGVTEPPNILVAAIAGGVIVAVLGVGYLVRTRRRV